MGKIFFVIITALLGWFLFKGFGKKTARPGEPERDQDVKPKTPLGAPERMVQCGLCGVHMPESDSVSTDGKLGCREPAHCGHRPRG